MNHRDFEELEKYRDSKGDSAFLPCIINRFLNEEANIIQGLKILDAIKTKYKNKLRYNLKDWKIYWRQKSNEIR